MGSQGRQLTGVEALLQARHAWDGLEVLNEPVRALAQAAVVDDVPAALHQQQVVKRLRHRQPGSASD